MPAPVTLWTVLSPVKAAPSGGFAGLDWPAHR